MSPSGQNSLVAGPEKTTMLDKTPAAGPSTPAPSPILLAKANLPRPSHLHLAPSLAVARTSRTRSTKLPRQRRRPTNRLSASTCPTTLPALAHRGSSRLLQAPPIPMSARPRPWPAPPPRPHGAHRGDGRRQRTNGHQTSTKKAPSTRGGCKAGRWGVSHHTRCLVGAAAVSSMPT